ncbi:MAG: AGE family epimerase/isomerase [Bacteroidaceae bacterium]|nr:AGE family epimerase/isomerase [Bacteroidaceae bacterium]
MKNRIIQMKEEMRDCLDNNILSFWLKMQDYENGGFYGRATSDGTIVKTANKGGILNARILWAFSAAYRVTGNEAYRNAATRAKDYISEYFIDHEYGGIYWELDHKGNPVDTKKQFYAIGFAIYGLSEYHRATGDETALLEAINLFNTIEEHSFDSKYNGYIEACTRQWDAIEDMRLSVSDLNYPKSQNTHLHIIEPYTNLYRVWKDARLERALRNLILIFTDKILNPNTFHLDLFFKNDWTRGGGQLESYGHDIECSWLMHETALVLGNEEILKKVEPIVQKVAKASEEGLISDGSMIHEANMDTGHADTDRHWWVEAEAVVGYMNIYQHFGDADALEKAFLCWEYIKEKIIDWQNGEWYTSRDKNELLNPDDDKAGFWKCPYHNTRMCLEIMERDFNQ